MSKSAVVTFPRWRHELRKYRRPSERRGAAFAHRGTHSRESPYSPDWERVWEPRDISGGPLASNREAKYTKGSSYVHKRHQPETELQALMEAMPFGDPETSVEVGAVLRERIGVAVDGLDERLRWIFEARVFRGMSVRQIGVELSISKTHVARLYEQAVRLLQVQLADLVGGD